MCPFGCSNAATGPNMQIELVDTDEAFFLDKIHIGLKHHDISLTADENRFLVMSMDYLKTRPDLCPSVKVLVAKCTVALEEVYMRDLASGDKELQETWRKQNGSLYRSSNRVISCIVQHWYLVHGPKVGRAPRKSEVKLYTWYSRSAKEIWDDYLLPKRSPN